MLGLPGNTERQLIDSLVKSIEELNSQLNIAATLKENGVEEELFTSTLDYIAENAVLDPCIASNPRVTSVEDLKKILECVYYGKPIIF